MDSKFQIKHPLTRPWLQFMSLFLSNYFCIFYFNYFLTQFFPFFIKSQLRPRKNKRTRFFWNLHFVPDLGSKDQIWQHCIQNTEIFFKFLLQLNRPTSFTSSPTSELNGFVDSNQLPSVYSASLNHPEESSQKGSKSPRKDSLPTISFKPRENQISGPHSIAPSASNSKTVPIADDKVTHEAKSIDSGPKKADSCAKTDVVSRNFALDNKELELLKNRRVSLCVPGTEPDGPLLETRRASSPFTNGGTELLIGPHDEHRLKTTAVIEDSRRSSKDLSSR